MALRFIGGARFIQNLYETAPATALKRNVARAAAFIPRSIVSDSSPNRRTSMTCGYLNTVGVAVGTLVVGDMVGLLLGVAVSPGANGTLVKGSTVGYGDGSRVSSEGAELGSTVGVSDGGSEGRPLGPADGGGEGVGDVGSELGWSVGTGVGGVGADVVGEAEGCAVDGAADG
jgi:hypothetical protein